MRIISKAFLSENLKNILKDIRNIKRTIADEHIRFEFISRESSINDFYLFLGRKEIIFGIFEKKQPFRTIIDTIFNSSILFSIKKDLFILFPNFIFLKTDIKRNFLKILKKILLFQNLTKRDFLLKKESLTVKELNKILSKLAETEPLMKKSIEEQLERSTKIDIEKNFSLCFVFKQDDIKKKIENKLFKIESLLESIQDKSLVEIDNLIFSYWFDYIVEKKPFYQFLEKNPSYSFSSSVPSVQFNTLNTITQENTFEKSRFFFSFTQKKIEAPTENLVDLDKVDSEEVQGKIETRVLKVENFDRRLRWNNLNFAVSNHILTIRTRPRTTDERFPPQLDGKYLKISEVLTGDIRTIIRKTTFLTEIEYSFSKEIKNRTVIEFLPNSFSFYGSLGIFLEEEYIDILLLNPQREYEIIEKNGYVYILPFQRNQQLNYISGITFHHWIYFILKPGVKRIKFYLFSWVDNNFESLVETNPLNLRFNQIAREIFAISLISPFPNKLSFSDVFHNTYQINVKGLLNLDNLIRATFAHGVGFFWFPLTGKNLFVFYRRERNLYDLFIPGIRVPSHLIDNNFQQYGRIVLAVQLELKIVFSIDNQRITDTITVNNIHLNNIFSIRNRVLQVNNTRFSIDYLEVEPFLFRITASLDVIKRIEEISLKVRYGIPQRSGTFIHSFIYSKNVNVRHLFRENTFLYNLEQGEPNLNVKLLELKRFNRNNFIENFLKIRIRKRKIPVIDFKNLLTELLCSFIKNDMYIEKVYKNIFETNLRNIPLSFIQNIIFYSKERDSLFIGKNKLEITRKLYETTGIFKTKPTDLFMSVAQRFLEVLDFEFIEFKISFGDFYVLGKEERRKIYLRFNLYTVTSDFSEFLGSIEIIDRDSKLLVKISSQNPIKFNPQTLESSIRLLLDQTVTIDFQVNENLIIENKSICDLYEWIGDNIISNKFISIVERVNWSTEEELKGKIKGVIDSLDINPEVHIVSFERENFYVFVPKNKSLKCLLEIPKEIKVTDNE